MARHAASRRRPPTVAFASRHNLGEAKALGVRDVLAFHKKAGLRVMDMVKSNWVYRQAAQLPSRHQIRLSLVLEARLWSGALHLARDRPLQGIRLVVSRR